MSKNLTFHPRNAHQGRYDFPALVRVCPALAAFVIITPRGEQSINFSDAAAVVQLNTALLALHYQIQHWVLPPGYLCPPVPGRADYVHHLADLLVAGTPYRSSALTALASQRIRVLDVGSGAGCIYPIIGARSYGWYFTATDIDPISVNTAKFIVQSNPSLQKFITPVLQKNPQHLFHGVIGKQDYFHLTLCNPPFFRSLAEATAANQRKTTNLAKHKAPLNRPAPYPPVVTAVTPELSARNFGGQKAELWCEGGELGFIQRMIDESQQFAQQVGWFSCLVSNNDHLVPLQKALKNTSMQQLKVVEMGQGQKISRFLAWSFHSAATLQCALHEATA